MAWNKEEDPGMIAFINQIHQVESSENLQALHSEWTALLSGLHIDREIRIDLNNWYQRCYKDRNEVSCQQDKVQRCSLFMEQLKAFIDNQQQVFKKITLQEILKNIQLQANNGSLVDIAINCIEKEHQLIETRYAEEQVIEPVQQVDQLETDFRCLVTLKSGLESVVESLQPKVDRFHELLKENEDYESHFHGIVKVLKGTKQPGKISEQTREMVQNQIQNTRKELTNKENEIASLKRECWRQVCNICQQLKTYKQELLASVDSWKEELKLKYAELYAEPNLETVSTWCAQTGQFVHQMLIYTWPKLEYVLDDAIVPLQLNQTKVNVSQQLEYLKSTLTNDLEVLLRRTFVVSEQEHYILKCDKKNLPTVSVRILAADKRDLHNYFPSSVTAYLVYDGDLNNCWNEQNNSLDIKAMVKVAKTFDKNQQAFAMSKNCEYREASFKTLSLKTATKLKQFERSSGKHVHEEKYRIVFVTDMNLKGTSHKIWTLSLPVVVTTGANQGLQSQASVMWECFGTNVYNLPIGDCSALPWNLVAKMLRAKMRTLCDKRDLSEENIRHLKSRLLGNQLMADDTEVTLKQFCFDKMEKSDSDAENPSYLQFSFWKWFMGCYNLINHYLRPYWSDGLIEGFLSKTDASRKLDLKRPPQDGLFILRFSDTNIVDSQGLNSIFGHLTACVMILRHNSTTNRNMKKIMDSLDVASSKSLEKKQLANIMKDTMDKTQKGNMYKVLYPDRQWEETFQKYLLKEESQEGKPTLGNIYVKPEQSWIVDLDQKLCEIEKSAAKSDRRNSTDSDMDPCGGKRRRMRNSFEDQLSCQSSQSPWQPQSPGQWSDCSEVSSMSDHSGMSTQSPMMLDISDMGCQRPMGIPNGKTVVESVIPNMDEFTTAMIPSVVASMGGDDLMPGDIQRTLESIMSPVSSMADSFQSQSSIISEGGTSNSSQIQYGTLSQMVVGNQPMVQQCPGAFDLSYPHFTTGDQGGQLNFAFTGNLQPQYTEDGNALMIFIEEQNTKLATSDGIQQEPNASQVFEMYSKLREEDKDKFRKLLPFEQKQAKTKPSTSTTKQSDSGGSTYALSSGEIQEGMNSGSIDPMFTDIIAGSSSSTSN